MQSFRRSYTPGGTLSARTAAVQGSESGDGQARNTAGPAGSSAGNPACFWVQLRWRTTLPETSEAIAVIPHKKLCRRGAIIVARITVWQYVMEQLPTVRWIIL
jgi:hypothetical protein